MKCHKVTYSKQGDVEFCFVFIIFETFVPEVSEMRFHNALMVTKTRSFVPSSYGQTVFIPVIELANHASEPNCSWNWDYNSRTFKFYALRPIEKGEELTFDYKSENLDWWKFTCGIDFEKEVLGNQKAESSETIPQRFNSCFMNDSCYS